MGEKQSQCHGNKVVFSPVAKEKSALKVLAMPFVHEGMIHARCSVTDAPTPLEVAQERRQWPTHKVAWLSGPPLTSLILFYAAADGSFVLPHQNTLPKEILFQ